MDLIDSRSQFKFEFIVGTPLIQSSAEPNKDTFLLSRRSIRKHPHVLPPISLNEPIEQKPLEIVGLEVNRKTDSHDAQHLLIKNANGTSIGPRVRLSRIDQSMLQLPKRTTFIHGRRAPDSILPRTWPSQLSYPAEHATANKTPNGSSSRQASTQNPDDPSNMVQRAHANATLNSSMTILKKMPANLSTMSNSQLSPRFYKRSSHPSLLSTNRDLSPVRLPSLLKRTTSTVIKPIPSAYIQESSHLRVPSSNMLHRPVLQPTPVLPIYAPRRSAQVYTEQHHLPIIRDHMVKANLSQRATLKCKSPAPNRSDSALSRSTTAGVTSALQHAKAFNPLKHMDVSALLSEAARHQLKRLFTQLDTDRDGHLTYPQVQKCLPSNLPRAQQTFFRVLYDLTTDASYFGLQEFFATAVLVDMIAKQDPQLWNTLLDDVDFNYYRDDILDSLDEFDHRSSSSATYKINYEQLVSLILRRNSKAKSDQVNKTFEKLLPAIKNMSWTRLEFIAFLPTIIYVESCLDHGRTLFRFRENSILDLHMQRSLFI